MGGIDLTNQRFGKLLVIGRDMETEGIKSRELRWICKCDCGGQKTIVSYSLRKGITQSCGCLQVENCRRIGQITTHGMSGTVEHMTWASMKQRCSNPTAVGYENYGGRGIRVCDRWENSFENFYTDMGPRPSELHSIERENNDGNYEPNNCFWKTDKEQSNNRRSNHFVEYDGRKLTISQLADLKGLKYSTVAQRIHRGWSVDDAANIPVQLIEL